MVRTVAAQLIQQHKPHRPARQSRHAKDSPSSGESLLVFRLLSLFLESLLLSEPESELEVVEPDSSQSAHSHEMRLRSQEKPVMACVGGVGGGVGDYKAAMGARVLPCGRFRQASGHCRRSLAAWQNGSNLQGGAGEVDVAVLALWALCNATWVGGAGGRAAIVGGGKARAFAGQAQQPQSHGAGDRVAVWMKMGQPPFLPSTILTMSSLPVAPESMPRTRTHLPHEPLNCGRFMAP